MAREPFHAPRVVNREPRCVTVDSGGTLLDQNDYPRLACVPNVV